MKKIIYSISMLVAVFAAASCVQEEAPVVDNEASKDAVVFSATFSEGTESKATLTEGVSSSTVAWEAEDEVVIFEGGNTFTYVATPDGENPKNATLSPKTESVSAGGKYHALFLHPSCAEGTIDGDVITTTLPAVQIADPNTFATHLAVAKSSGTSFAFKNVCGLVRVVISTTDVKSVVLEGLNDEVVAGGIKIHVSDEPTWEVDGTNGSKTVTLKAESDATAIAPGVYFFAVLPQTFENGFKVTSNKLSGDPVVRTTAAGVTVERCDIVKGNANGIAGKGTEADPYVIMTAQDMCDMRRLAPLGEETWFKLGADIDMADVEKWTPVNYDGNFERMIHFDGAKVVNPKTKADCYTISNFAPTSFVNESDVAANYPSIFGVLYGSCKNVNIVNASVAGTVVTGIVGGYVGTTGKPAECVNVHVQGTVAQTNSDRTGGFAGAGRNATMSNCSVDVVITSTRQDVGGFFGRTYDSVVMTECTANVDIESSTTEADSWRNRVGGLIGYVSGDSVEISDCHSSGVIEDVTDVTSSHTAAIGGLVGHLSSSNNQVINCSSSVEITAIYGASVGGAVGINGAGTLTMESTTTSGKLEGDTNVGGILGIIEPNVTGAEFNNCSSSAEVQGHGHYCGGLAGWIQSKEPVSFKDCFATGDVTSTGSSIAGLVGGVTYANEQNPVVGRVTFSKCYATGDVTGSNNVGGLIGNRNSEADITECYATGNVKGSGAVGGLIGNLMKPGIVTDCYATGDVNASGNYVGGLIGIVANGATVKESFYRGTVTVTGNSAGGLIGSYSNGGTLKDCYSEGNVSGTGYNVSGLVAHSKGNLVIDGCYHIGDVIGQNVRVGGLVAYMEDGSTGKISNSYNEGTVKSTYNNAGAINVGGIAGYCWMDEFTNCYASGEVSCIGRQCGGIVAFQKVASTFSKCHFTGDVSASWHAAGLVSRCDPSITISNCWTEGTSTAAARDASGLLGYNASTAEITNCFTDMIVKGQYNIGGLVGDSNTIVTITKSIAWGTSTSTNDNTAIGAIVGYVKDAAGSTITSCYYNPSFTPAAGATGLHGTVAGVGETVSSLATTLGWDPAIWDLTGDYPVLK